MKPKRLRETAPNYVRRLLLDTAATLVIIGLSGCLHSNAVQVATDPIPSPSTLDRSLTDLLTGKVCFTRGDFIYLKDLDSGKEVRLLQGQSPQVSPDGTRVLFVSSVSHEGSWRAKLRVKLLDLKSNIVQEVLPLSQLEAYNLIWSKDGSSIAFESADAGPGTSFGQFNPTTGEWKIIIRSGNLRVNENEAPFALSSWAPDDRSLLIYSLENLYEVSLDGKVVWQMPLKSLEIDSETRFSLSSDKKYLLFDTTIDTKERPVNDAVKMLDLSTKEVITITPDTVEARTPVWSPTEQAILFTCMKRHDHPHQTSICTIGVDGQNLSVLVNDAARASYSFR